MRPTLEIFSQGEEIITGQTVDTNAAWLAQCAITLGFKLTRHTAVGDDLDDLMALLREIAARADCCICTGGLGPTQDDLTAEAVALAFGLPLEFDSQAFAQIQAFFAVRNRKMPESNRKQAMLPKGALRIDNSHGTAPGFAVQQERCWFVFLPGVPSEMQAMFTHKIAPMLPQRFALKPSLLVCIKTFGLGESELQQRVNSLELPAGVQLGFRADSHEVQTKLLFPHGYPEAALDTLVDAVVELFGDAVFAVDFQNGQTDGISHVVNQLMAQSGHTLSIIETVSQGALASQCIGEWLLESCHGHKLEQIALKLAINAEFIGGGSLPDVAIKLAHAAQKKHQAEWILVQLYEGGYQCFRDHDKAITVHTVLYAGTLVKQSAYTVVGSAKRKQNQATLVSLDLLRKHLQFGQYAGTDFDTGKGVKRYGLRLIRDGHVWPE